MLTPLTLNQMCDNVNYAEPKEANHSTSTRIKANQKKKKK